MNMLIPQNPPATALPKARLFAQDQIATSHAPFRFKLGDTVRIACKKTMLHWYNVGLINTTDPLEHEKAKKKNTKRVIDDTDADDELPEDDGPLETDGDDPLDVEQEAEGSTDEDDDDGEGHDGTPKPTAPRRKAAGRR